MILAGKVRMENGKADKPGRLVSEEAEVQIIEEIHPYVSRGGLKLAHALDIFEISPLGKTAADIGASTGGFTDCLIQRGAEKVFAVDVGYGQLAWKIRNNPRVVCLDRKNARHLEFDDLGTSIDLAVMDVSFISLKLVLPPVLEILKPEGDFIMLVKPQFEVGKDEVERKGIIKDSEKHLQVITGLNQFVREQGWAVCGLTTSPITGQKGNREFLMHGAGTYRNRQINSVSIRREVLQ